MTTEILSTIILSLLLLIAIMQIRYYNLKNSTSVNAIMGLRDRNQDLEKENAELKNIRDSFAEANEIKNKKIEKLERITKL